MLILITGGSSGIGYALAEEYLRRGHNVIIVADGVDKLASAEQQLRRIAPTVWSYACDVGDIEAVPRMAEKVLQDHGCPDILVNNAGYAVYDTFDQTEYREMNRLIEVNLLGTLRCIHCFLPAMVARGSGHLVNVGSVGGLLPLTPVATYASAKYGIVGISDCLRLELKDSGIHVHLVCPGRVVTSFFDHPSFNRRAHRPEHDLTIPMKTVIRAITRAVETNRYASTPAHWTIRIMILLRRLWPALINVLFQKVCGKRIRDLRRNPANVEP